MFGARSRSHVGPLPQQAAGRCPSASAPSRVGRQSPAGRLPTVTDEDTVILDANSMLLAGEVSCKLLEVEAAPSA